MSSQESRSSRSLPSTRTVARALAAAGAALWLTALAGCPGQLPFTPRTVDGGLPVRLDAAPTPPPPPPPAMADAAATPPPPARDGGIRPDAATPPPPTPDAGAGVAAYCTSTTEVIARILRPRCALCHDATTASYVGFDVVAADVRTRLRQASGVCMGRPFVTTSPAVGGYFFDKLGATPPCGQRMPPVGAELPAAEIDCLKAWAAANP